MKELYTVFTSPGNGRLLKSAPDEFFKAISQMFEIDLNAKNTQCVFHKSMPDGKLHLFEHGDYFGWICIINEKDMPSEHADKH